MTTKAKHFVSRKIDNNINEIEERKQIKQKQFNLNVKLKNTLKIDPVESKKVLIDLIDITMSDPSREDMLPDLKNTVNAIAEEFFADKEILENMVRTSVHDYTTSIHVTNSMLYGFSYGYYEKLPMLEIKQLCLACLMHDIGKIQVPDYILQSSRKLTYNEFEIIKQHPLVSYNILKKTNLPESLMIASLEHHEKLDGSGYPYGITHPKKLSRLLTIIDIFEALTSWRPYKESISGFKALEIMKKEEVETGKLDKKLFRNFAYSLVGMRIK
jgi:HD-GYP domain-containing protein (c-di-GMP phosphodiesterase class II)